MKKIILISASLLILTGCATKPVPVKVDSEPILVGLPISERVEKSSKTINEQLDLLTKLNNKKYVGTYEMVQHNNGLDARIGSTRTLPASYANINNPEVKVSSVNASKLSKVNSGVDTTKSSVSTVFPVVDSKNESTVIVSKVSGKMSQKIKKIDWDNESANELGKMFAESLGYHFVVNGNQDVAIVLKVENETIESAINKFKDIMAKKAVIMVVENNQTFNIIYKK
jgi:hypothetical protein